jgi:hypothetical protein
MAIYKRTIGKGFRFNKLRKWSRTKGSFFIIKQDEQAGPPPPANSGFILQENGAVVLAEDGAKCIVEF